MSVRDQLEPIEKASREELRALQLDRLRSGSTPNPRPQPISQASSSAPPRSTAISVARSRMARSTAISVRSSVVCDEVVPAADMDRALARAGDDLTNAGAASTIGNRRGLRIAQEPIDDFRRYFAAYARDQAFCCFSPALIANLERNWDAQNRKT